MCRKIIIRRITAQVSYLLFRYNILYILTRTVSSKDEISNFLCVFAHSNDCTNCITYFITILMRETREMRHTTADKQKSLFFFFLERIVRILDGFSKDVWNFVFYNRLLYLLLYLYAFARRFTLNNYYCAR